MPPSDEVAELLHRLRSAQEGLNRPRPGGAEFTEDAVLYRLDTTRNILKLLWHEAHGLYTNWLETERLEDTGGD